MSATMTREEREQFLAGVHVGVLSVVSEGGGGPLAVPVWYSYQPGGPVVGGIPIWSQPGDFRHRSLPTTSRSIRGSTGGMTGQ
jgi:hypothetical protein